MHASLCTCPSVQVKGVNQSNGVYAALAAIMLLACLTFGVTWAACMVIGVMDTVRQRRMRKLLIRASKAQQQAAQAGGMDGQDRPMADEEDPEPLDHVASVSRRGSLDRSSVRDVLNPLQRARKMLGSGTSSRFIGQSSQNEGQQTQQSGGTSTSGLGTSGHGPSIPTATLSGLVVYSNPMQRPRRLLGAGMGISSPLAVAGGSGSPRRSVPMAGDVAGGLALGSSPDPGGQPASASGGAPGRVRMSTAALIARRLSGHGASMLAALSREPPASPEHSGYRHAGHPSSNSNADRSGHGGRAARAAAMVSQRSPR